jgi:hypothetical protein
MGLRSTVLDIQVESQYTERFYGLYQVFSI